MVESEDVVQPGEVTGTAGVASSSSGSDEETFGFYFKFLYKIDWITISLPFIIGSSLFYSIYAYRFKRLSTRVRTKTLIAT